MSEQNVKKDILNLAGDLSEPLKEIFIKGNFNVCTEYTENTSFIIVKDWKESWDNFGKKYKTVESGIIVVSLSYVLDKAGFFAVNGRAVFDSQVLDDSLLSKVVQRLFVVDSAVNVEYAYDQLLQKIFSFKLTGHLSIGHYLDTVAACAVGQDFNIVHLQAFYVNALSYLTYLQRAKICFNPIDVQYGYSETGFVLQFVVSVDSMYSDYLLASMKESDSKNPVKSLLTWCEQQADFFDIYQLKNAGKLVISGLWSKKVDVKFHSLLINNISMYSPGSQRGHSVQYVSGGVAPDSFVLEVKKLPGEGITSLSWYFAKHPEDFALILHYLGVRKSENPDLHLDTIDQLDKCLRNYSDQQAIEHLTDYDKKLLLDSFNQVDQKKKVFDQVVEEVQTLAFRVEADSVSRVKGGNGEEELLTKLGGNFSEKEEKTKLTGGFSEEEEITKLSGGFSEEERITRLNGGSLENETVTVFSGGGHATKEHTKIFHGNANEDDTDKTSGDIFGSEKIIKRHDGSLKNEASIHFREDLSEDEDIRRLSGGITEHETVTKISRGPSNEEDEVTQFTNASFENNEVVKIHGKSYKKGEGTDFNTSSNENKDFTKFSRDSNEKEEVTKISSTSGEDVDSIKIHSSFDGNKNIRRLKGELQEDEESTVLSGNHSKKFQESNQNAFLKGKPLEDSIKYAFKSQQNDTPRKNELKRPDQQLIKIKNIVNAMKKELDATKRKLAFYQKRNETSSNGSEELVPEMQESKASDWTSKSLENEIIIKNKEIAKRDTQILLLKENQQKAAERHEIMLKEYQNRIQEISSAHADSPIVQEHEELQKLRTENQTMSSMIEMGNKKIKVLSEGYDRIKKQSEEKLANQLKIFGTNKNEMILQLKQAQEKGIQAEGKCRSLEFNLEKLQSEYDKLKLEHEKNQINGSDFDSEKVIKELRLEDANQKQQLKQSERTIKALEQKLKFLTEQVASAQKNGNGNKAHATGDMNKAAELKIKQLEASIEKNTSAANKIKEELAEKKKENLKLKTDLQLTQNQLQEAQRRIGVLDKKRAA